MTDRDRQNQALVSLCNALSRCEQEQVDLTDVIRHFYAWTLRQRKQKEPVVKYVRLTEESPLPEIGAKVRVESEPVEPHCVGDIGTVTCHHDVSWNGRPILGIRVDGKPTGEGDWDFEYYTLSELSLVVEE